MSSFALYYDAHLLDKKEQVDINSIGTNQKHLNINKCHNLHQVLAKYKKPFDGSLGVWNGYNIEHTQYLVSMNKYSKKNSNTWLMLGSKKNVEPLNGLCLVSVLQKRRPSQTDL